MEVKSFQDPDPAYIEFRSIDIAETKDLDESTRMCALAIEHARQRAALQHLSFEQAGT